MVWKNALLLLGDVTRPDYERLKRQSANQRTKILHWLTIAKFDSANYCEIQIFYASGNECTHVQALLSHSSRVCR